MNKLQKYQKVNACETSEQLCACILSFADAEGNIQGRTRKFNAEKMAKQAQIYFDDRTHGIPPNVITREFGLRQQAMYIKFYS